MTRRILLYTLLLIAGTQSLSAKEPEVIPEVRSDNSVDFYLKGAKGNRIRTVVFNFSSMNNTTLPTGEICREARYGQQCLLTLHPINKKKSIDFLYYCLIYDGRIDPKIDTALVYRMPVSTAKPVHVMRTTDVMDHVRGIDKKERKQIGFSFKMERGDTVYAMRRGHVIRIRQQQSEPNSDVSFTSQNCKVKIQHPDGSFAEYGCLDKDHILVGLEDEVLPGTPIALAGSYDGAEYNAGVICYTAVKNPEYKTQSDRYLVPRYFFPLFATTEGPLHLEGDKEYTATMNDELRLRELSKKELRKAKQLQEKR